MKRSKTYYYHTFTDDFISSGNQNYQLPSDYQWLHKGKLGTMVSLIITGIADIISWFLFRIIMRPKLVSAEKIKDHQDGGFFVYGNHTQAQSDALIAFHLLPRHLINIIATPANLGNLIVGKLLPFAGILPIPATFRQLIDFTKVVKQQALSGHAVFIYPEAHVWPFYTKIRPFSAASFHYPVDTGLASFCLTTTYHSRSWSKNPRIIIYVEGPFYPNADLTTKQQAADLRQQIYDCMKKRASLNDVEYIHYKKV
ncbi:lysophospholipid acyltransferase family protein [Loigolactobacillus binensis]|uniref:1-acyl-sn-glycerol-3-phosphate acyltransferase n=1 Tax=Loigolactobacillus binensis TaxID=2559922 RepID=A0ABW3EH78_9LACO|nr:1-acyl-sn-glycerol-3-phosphate acyltransferase [Loigolactobacillus binensis]